VSEKLKTCPFCGATASLNKSFIRFYVMCDNNMCFIRPRSPKIGDVGDKEIAIKSWNERKAEGQVKGD